MCKFSFISFTRSKEEIEELISFINLWNSSDVCSHLPGYFSLLNESNHLTRYSQLLEKHKYSSHILRGIYKTCNNASYLILHPLRFYTNYKIQSISWIEASDLCRSLGSYLPILNNKDEIEELVSVIRSTTNWMPPISGVYIGLYSDKVKPSCEIK